MDNFSYLAIVWAMYFSPLSENNDDESDSQLLRQWTLKSNYSAQPKRQLQPKTALMGP